MAKNTSAARRVLEMMATDVRLFEIGAEVAAFWVRLVAAIVEFGTGGVLQCGVDGAPSLQSLARFRFHLSETQLETYLETCAKTRLITYDAETGAVGLAGPLALSRRAAASQENGKKGGRPRKNPSVTPSNDPRQRFAMMPVPGGAAAPSENLTETQQHSSAPKLSLEHNSKAQAEPCATDIDQAYRVIGPKALDAAGFDPSRSMANYGIVRQWCADALRAGLTAEQTERLVIGTISRVAERLNARSQSASHLGYFGKAVQTAIADRDVPAKPETAEEKAAGRRFEQAMSEHMERVSRGDRSSVMPKLEDFLPQARAA